MAAVALSGADTIMINNTLLTDLADGDCVTLNFPNDIAVMKIGKNGNAIYGFNATGQMAECRIRVIRSSADDKFLNNLLAQQNGANGANFAQTVLVIGEFVKLIGDGSGNLSHDTYIFAGGIFKKQVDAKMNVEGDTAQSIAEYILHFSSAPRAIT